MMYTLKSISAEAVPAALEKAERYRLLNEPELAESICRDVLAAEPDHQEALVMLLLALTDQFRGGHPECIAQAQAVLPRLHDEYDRLYYTGLIRERRGLAQLSQGAPGGGRVACEWLREAMELYERAEALRPAGNDNAILRWNTCARVMTRHHLAPEPEEHYQPALEDS
jgi:tetratricopeptide (TPR) repeat protein